MPVSYPIRARMQPGIGRRIRADGSLPGLARPAAKDRVPPPEPASKLSRIRHISFKEADVAAHWSGSADLTQVPRTARFGSQPGLVLAAWAVLLGASVVQDVIGLDAGARAWLLDVDSERSFYTWFSQLLLALAGLLLVDTGARTARRSRWAGVQFIGLGVLFFLLSADEALSFHEKLSGRLTGLGGLHFAWVIPAAVSLAGLVAAIPFLRALGPRVRVLMLASAGVFLFGALGMEAVGGQVFLATGEDVLARPYRALVISRKAQKGWA